MKRKLQAILIFALILSVFALLLTGCKQTGEDGKFTVTFDSMGGSAVGSVSVDEGGLLTAPAEPTRDGYDFTGWYKERECVNEWQFDTDTVNENLTLYAGWEEYTSNVDVTAVTGGEVENKNISMIVDTTVTELNMSDLVTLSSKKASWKLFNERTYEEIPNHTASLKDGSNKFTVMVYNSRDVQVNRYSLEIYKKYKVTVSVLGVKGIDMPQYEYSVTVLDPLPEPTGVEVEGYTVDGFTCTYNFGEPLPKDASKTIYVRAQLTAKTYNVTLDANGGTIGGVSKKTVSATFGGYPTLGKPTRTGYTFAGWYAGETLVPIESRGGTTASPWNIADDVTLKAKWTVYTLTTNVHDSELGTCTQMNEDAVIPGVKVSLTATTRQYGVFIGWYEGDTLLSKNKTYSYEMPARDVVLTAKFGQLKLTWNNDRGYIKDYSPAANTYAYTGGQKVTYTAITRNGYVFAGWFDEGGERVCETLEVTLTANDEVKTYSPKWSQVTLAKNINDAGRVNDFSKEVYIAGAEVSAVAHTTPGYNFLGWFDGDEILSEDLSFTFEMPLVDKTYTAKWNFYTVKVNASPEDGGTASMSFTVKFDVNGGDEDSTPEPQTAGPGERWSYPALPTRSGYVLKGWYLEPECETIYDFSKATPVHNLTLYAGWEQTVTSGYTKITVIDTRDYYYVGPDGWNTKYYSQSSSQTTNDKNRKYNYTYFTCLSDNSNIRFSYQVTTSDVTKNSPVYLDIYNVTQDKAVVTGENLRDTFKGQEQYTLAHDIYANNGDILYFRTYTYGQYAFSLRIYFSGNGASTNRVSTDEAKIAVGEETTLSAVTKEGYNFLGWYDGDVQVSSQLNYTFIMTAENREYTAKWAKGVILEKNIEEAGTVEVDNAVAAVGEEVTLTATTKTGYTFLGWYEDETLIGNHAHTITVTVEATSKTYTAKWIKVTLEKAPEEGGTITAGLDSTYVVGDRVTVTAVTNIGYIWMGWYEGNSQVESGLSYSFDMPDESTTLVATWELCTDHTPNSDCICTKCGRVAHTAVNCVCSVCGHVDHSAAIEANGYCRHTEGETDYIYMGYFPQTVKTDDVTVSALPDADGFYGGSDGERYVKSSSSKRQPQGFKFNDGSPVKEETYYFKVEPIKWRILKEENGTIRLMSDLILTYIRYGYQSVTVSTPLSKAGTYTTHPDVPSKTVRIYNYQYSYIREWLNEEFYKVAFTANSQSLIQTNAIANSTSFTSGDRVFLLSKEEITDSKYGFSGETVPQVERQLLTSDYCRTSGIEASYDTNNGSWMLRTQGNSDTFIYGVDYAGKVDQINIINTKVDPNTKLDKDKIAPWGIVPAVVITVA